MDVLIILSGLITIITLLAIGLAYGAFVWGWVCFKFWYWFVLPVFTTLPEVTFIQCVGLMMFISLFKSTESQVINKEYVNQDATNILQIIAPLIVLFVGWIVKIFIIGS